MYGQTEIKQLYRQAESFADREVTVVGWVKNLRDQKAFAFIQMSDGSFFTPLQVVVDAQRVDNYDEVIKQGVGAALVIKGSVKLTPGAKQALELQASEVKVEGVSAADYPIQPKRHSNEFLRSVAHLRPRTNLFSAVFRVRSEAALAIHRFFGERNFVYVNTPIITSSDAEGAGEMFQVTSLDLKNLPLNEDGSIDYSQDFFCKKTSLTVSGQLNAETFAQAFAKVYTFGPTFRAEHSNTARHAAEFWMVEPEIAFADLEDDMRLAEDMLRYTIKELMERCPEELAFCNQWVDKGLLARLQNVADSDFAVITYSEAIKELEARNKDFKYPVFWGADIQTEHERFLSEQLFKGPVFVTDYPKDIKAFYMKLNEDEKTVRAMDCLVPGIGEIIGGSQREDDLAKLLKRINEMGLNEEDYSWYLDLRRYGSTHHAGFGLGFERLVMYVTGVSNIRDVCAFPRTTGAAHF